MTRWCSTQEGSGFEGVCMTYDVFLHSGRYKSEKGKGKDLPLLLSKHGICPRVKSLLFNLSMFTIFVSASPAFAIQELSHCWEFSIQCGPASIEGEREREMPYPSESAVSGFWKGFGSRGRCRNHVSLVGFSIRNRQMPFSTIGMLSIALGTQIGRWLPTRMESFLPKYCLSVFAGHKLCAL